MFLLKKGCVMRFFQNKYIKILSLSFVFGALAMFFFGDRLWAAGRGDDSSSNTQNLKDGNQKSLQKQPVGGRAGLAQVRGGKKSLSPELIKALEEEQSVSTVTSSGFQLAEKDDGEDVYTQSEAHLQLDEVKKQMAEFSLYAEGTILKPGEVKVEKTPNEIVTPYLNIVAAALNKEVELKKTHYVFYHAATNEWRVPQDLYKLLYAYYNPLKPVKDFVFMRFTDMPTITAKDYLSEHVEEFGGINDNVRAERTKMISVNLSLFGSVGFAGECSWNYFVMNKSHSWPLDSNYQEVLDAFELSYDAKQLESEANELGKMLVDATSEQIYYQIFIPKEKVDDIAWLAWVIGFPAHPKSMDLVLKSIGNKPLVGSVTGPAVKKLMKRFKKEGEDNPLYKELLDSVENGDFGVDAFLKVYCNTPWKLEHPNDTQARLLITNDLMLNPQSGVKFFTYVTTPQDVQEAYLKKVEALAKKIIDQNKNKTK